MKVLVIDQFADLGGGQMCLLDLLPEFRKQGWTVQAALPSAGSFSTRLVADGIPVDFFGCCTYQHGRKSLLDVFRFPVDITRQARHFANLVTHHKPDLIYVNGPRTLPAAAISARHTPLLFHAHHHISQSTVRALVKSCVKGRNIAVVACSQSVGDRYRKYRSDKHFTVVPNGVADQGYRDRFQHRLRCPRIGIVGRVTPGKGHLIFLQSARAVAAKIPGARFIICGITDRADRIYEQHIRRMSDELPVEWMGWREDMAQVFAEIDILLIPSTSEGLPRVMLEAFSAGVAVVAFPTGGIPEAIRDGETGFLVAQRSPAALARKIEDILNSRVALKTVSRNAREQWEHSYTLERYRTGVVAFAKRVAGR